MENLRSKRVLANNKPRYVDESDEKIAKRSRKSLSVYSGDNQKKKSSNSRLSNCQYCDYTTSKRNLLLRHSRTHKDEPPFTCKVCEYEFETNSLLIDHKSKHSNMKQFQCDDCDGSYRTSGELLRHIRYRHTHEKPYKCTMCDNAFVERFKLTRHLWGHTAMNTQKCPHCSFTSSNAVKFRKHNNIHNDPDYKSPCEKNKTYKCNECGLSFSQKQILIRHIMCTCKNGHKRKVFQLKKESSDSMQEIQDSDDKLISSQLLAINKYLSKGQVILIPETDGEKYVMIKVISDDEAVKAYDADEEAVKACNHEIVKVCNNKPVKACDDEIVNVSDNEAVNAFDDDIVKAYDDEAIKACDDDIVTACGDESVKACDVELEKNYKTSDVDSEREMRYNSTDTDKETEEYSDSDVEIEPFFGFDLTDT